jgi:hypothetical protein
MVYTRDNPSPRYRELERVYRQVHETGLPESGIEAADLFDGRSLFDHIPRVRALAVETGARTVLDYGSGKGQLYSRRNFVLGDGTAVTSIKEYWGVEDIRCFDPGVPEFADPPAAPYDGVVCTDVLEHIPEEDIPWFVSELFRYAKRFVYANIAAFPATKTLPNGWNAHVTIRPPAWWAKQIQAAAQGWPGMAYEFQVRERSATPGLVRKLFGSPKWKTTAISVGIRQVA